MKRNIFCMTFIFFVTSAVAQTTTTSTSTSQILNSLVVPTSPAFSITDITPTLVQNPTTPKAFALGIAQSFQSGSGFPNNYSAEFAPIWWINPKGINIYSYLGLTKPNIEDKKTQFKENIWSGLRNTTLSVAFINKDLIPDTSKATQNIFSIGVHTTLIKIYGGTYIAKLDTEIKKWHTDAIEELNKNNLIEDAISDLPSTDPDSVHKKKIADIEKKYSEVNTPDDLKAINLLLAMKPVFAWDLSAALAEYGINNNQAEKTGRVGVWSSFALNLPLDKKSGSQTNYLNINILGRYLVDNFQQLSNGIVGVGNNTDIGGNVGFEFNKLSIAVESLYRFINSVPSTQNRTVGIISVKLTDKIYVNGTFGKDFAGPAKLISAFGINWGFGNEKVSLP